MHHIKVVQESFLSLYLKKVLLVIWIVFLTPQTFHTHAPREILHEIRASVLQASSINKSKEHLLNVVMLKLLLVGKSLIKLFFLFLDYFGSTLDFRISGYLGVVGRIICLPLLLILDVLIVPHVVNFPYDAA